MTSTKTNIRIYKGVMIQPLPLGGYRIMFEGFTFTKASSLRNAQELITNALASWAVARDGMLVAK